MLKEIGKALGISGGGGDFLTNFLANRLTSELVGNKSNKEALVGTLLMQGLGAENPLGNLFGGEKAAQAEQMSGLEGLMSQGVDRSLAKAAVESRAKNKIQDALASRAGLASVTPFKQADNTLGYSKFLIDAGILDPNSKIASLLNSRVGEAGASMLISSLLDKYSEDESIGPESVPFGGYGPTASLNMRGGNTFNAANGGAAPPFRRRDGGIMPSEGSGTKDDVPAMLTAGEFVLTRDAVKGLGNGDLNQGIQKAYSMMDNLERRA